MKFFSSRKNRQREAELDAELQSHLDESIRERADRGQPHRDANFAARVEFGNVGLVRETTRDNWGGRSLEILLRDIRFGLRTLRRVPPLPQQSSARWLSASAQTSQSSASSTPCFSNRFPIKILRASSPLKNTNTARPLKRLFLLPGFRRHRQAQFLVHRRRPLSRRRRYDYQHRHPDQNSWRCT